MKSPEAKQALTEFLLRQPEAVRAQMALVTPKSLGQDHLLHISYDNAITNFQPSVTKRSLPGENRTVPRISTAPSLLACFAGYQTDLNDFHEHPKTFNADRTRKVEFQGGWVIYGLPFEYAIRPGKKLLPDAKITDEHWLVTYDRYTVDFVPRKLGKVFYDRVEYVPRKNNVPKAVITMVLEVLPEQVVNFGQDVHLGTGYWEVQVSNLHNWSGVDKIEILRVKEVTEDEYLSRKVLTAGLLSMDQNIPASVTF